MNPSASRIPGIQIEVRVDRETLLPGRVWCAERPRALIAIVHGLGEHSGRYAALAEALVERGFTVAALDLPGHGRNRLRKGEEAAGLLEQPRRRELLVRGREPDLGGHARLLPAGGQPIRALRRSGSGDRGRLRQARHRLIHVLL